LWQHSRENERGWGRVDAAPRGWGESELERSAQERHTKSRALSLPTACAGEPGGGKDGGGGGGGCMRGSEGGWWGAGR